MLPAFLANLDPSIYFSNNYVVLDFEIDTSHGDYGNPVHPANQMLLAVWATSEGHKHGRRASALWGGEFDMGPLVEAIESADFVVAHQAKYELAWLRRCGLDLAKVLPFDTKIAEFVLLGNLAAGDDRGMPPVSTSLDDCCIRRGWRPKDPVVDILMGNGINPVRMPRPWLEGRCRQDVASTEALFKDQLRRLVASNRLAVQYTRCLLTPVLADIEFSGMALDEIAVEKTYQEFFDRKIELEQKMSALTGGINWRSSKQAGEFLYDVLKFDELVRHNGKPKRTVTDKRMTSQKAMDQLVATTDAQREFLTLRKEIGKVSAALSKSLEFFMGVCKERGGVFHAEFNQTTTATHRLSSSGIAMHFDLFKRKDGKPAAKRAQFQNLARAFKVLFRARREGWLMAEADGSQLEFRVAAFLGQDKQAMADIENPDYDVHMFTASELNKVPLSEVTTGGTESMRQKAKSETFKPLYGGTKGTPDQERYYRAFRQRYPELAATQEAWVYEVLNTKRLVTPWGMQYYWPQASMSRSGYVNVTSSVYNYPVQALATAEIIPVALVYFWHRLRERNLMDRIVVVNTVHDSLAAEIAPDAREEFTQLAKQCFTTDVYNYLDKVYKLCFNVPLGCGIKIGPRWGKGDEVKFNVWNTGKEVRINE